ncbi:MAG: hypothetical protein IJX68_09155, partial [Rikenellaceae bacterium]|nr:hypothetical protein [Rikenellaceae bacterium]
CESSSLYFLEEGSAVFGCGEGVTACKTSKLVASLLLYIFCGLCCFRFCEDLAACKTSELIANLLLYIFWEGFVFSVVPSEYARGGVGRCD